MPETSTLPAAAHTDIQLPVEVEAVVERLFQLPAGQRLEIARRLDASVGPGEMTEAWSLEVGRRIREIESGAVAGILSTQVRKEIEELVGEKL